MPSLEPQKVSTRFAISKLWNWQGAIGCKSKRNLSTLKTALALWLLWEPHTHTCTHTRWGWSGPRVWEPRSLGSWPHHSTPPQVILVHLGTGRTQEYRLSSPTQVSFTKPQVFPRAGRNQEPELPAPTSLLELEEEPRSPASQACAQTQTSALCRYQIHPDTPKFFAHPGPWEALFNTSYPYPCT